MYVTNLSPRQFKHEVGSWQITAATRTIVQWDAVMVDGAEVERDSGPDNDLIAPTITVMWTASEATMVRRISRDERG
jgi:hypothetical protein